MTKILQILLANIILMGLWTQVQAKEVEIKKSAMKIGWAEVDITPPSTMLPVDLRGQYYSRIASEVDSPLTATAMAIESDSGEQWILVSIDTVDIGPGGGREKYPMDHEGLLMDVRADLKGVMPKFDLSKLTLVATHTHTAPYMNKTINHYREDGRNLDKLASFDNSTYHTYVKSKINSVIKQAWNNRAYGGLALAQGSVNVGHSRIGVYADGHHEMPGNVFSSDFVRFLTPPDPTLNLIFTTDTSGKLTGIMINIVSPSQTNEIKKYISADFWHNTKIELRKLYGNEISMLPFGGAAGDMNSNHPFNDDKSYSRPESIGKRIASEISDVFASAKDKVQFSLEMGHAIKDINLTTHEFYQRHPHPHYKEKREKYLAEIHAVRLGNSVWVNNPFELYNGWGKEIQNQSKANQTFIAQMSGLNRGGYLPTQEAMDGGKGLLYGTSFRDGWCGPKGGEELVNHTVALIDNLFDANNWTTGIYIENLSIVDTLTVLDASSVSLYFTDNIETGWDFILVYDAYNTLIGKYTGGIDKTIMIDSNTTHMRLVYCKTR